MPAADEHARYQRYIARLDAEGEPSDRFVSTFMEEVISDQDRVMAESATIALLDHPSLTESLLDSIERAMPDDWSAAARRLEERRLQLQLEANPANLALWDRAVSSGSCRLHLWLLDWSRVPDETLESLADHGATRAVRNRASQALRSRSGT